MKPWVGLCAMLLMSTALQGQNAVEPYPDVKVISPAMGWHQQEMRSKNGALELIWEYADEEKYLQASDLNGDGKIDYLRLQKPLNSFHHYVWLDNDHDGFFDQLSVNHEGKCHITVPSLGVFTKLKPPFELFEAKGEAHPLLTEAQHWSQTEGVGFDLMKHTRFYQYLKKGVMAHWLQKDPSELHFKAEQLKVMKSSVTPKTHTPFRAWANVMLQDDTFRTYTLDPKHGALFHGCLVPAGENAWFEGFSRGAMRRDENLYEFDRTPFEHAEGWVTHTRINFIEGQDKAPQRSVAKLAFKTTHHAGSEYDLWIVTIGSEQSSHKLFRYKWKNGPEVFSSDNVYHNGYLKASRDDAGH